MCLKCTAVDSNKNADENDKDLGHIFRKNSNLLVNLAQSAFHFCHKTFKIYKFKVKMSTVFIAMLGILLKLSLLMLLSLQMVEQLSSQEEGEVLERRQSRSF